jgi:hypothetical protein
VTPAGGTCETVTAMPLEIEDPTVVGPNATGIGRLLCGFVK